MRLTKHIAIAVVSLAASLTSVFAASTSISGTPHDLSGKGWGSTELCIFCHTPHFAQTNVTSAPLWNHATTVSSYALYSSATLNATVGQPGPTSKLCLSCHDGSVAVDSFAIAGVVRSGTAYISSTNLVGGGSGHSLMGDHPIGFTYDSGLATADGGLVTPNSSNYVDSAHTITLYAGKMECASCHGVHDNSNTKFLRIANTGSAMCLKCHTK